MGAAAQGGNVGMGGKEGDFESLAQRVANLEKKNDAFNVYLNYAASAQALYDGNEWSSKIANKQLRLEIKGNITPKLFYRLRHRMNKGNSAQTEDNFAKATDIMMVGYHFNDKFTVMAGKMCQIWGGHEFDENPMYIYQYSDMVDNMVAKATDIMMVGYHFNDKFTVMAGKMCQIWGGHEFDENPMYIYQYSDMVDNMDNFMAGVVLSYTPTPTRWRLQ